MKVRKTSLRHWSYLVRGGLNVALAIAVRRLSSRREPTVVFYGHTFNGNLKALADYVRDQGEITCFFATIDPLYCASLRADPTATAAPLNLLRTRDVVRVARSGAVVTDREAQILEFLNRASDLPFVDVWHGLPFKGFKSESFKYLRHYCEVWVSSPTLRDIYRTKLGVSADQLQVTGYPRTDRLVTGDFSAAAIRQKYGIGERHIRIVLVAPTWRQDDKGRSIIPFGVTQEQFFAAMDRLGKETGTLFIFRAHLNVHNADRMPSMEHVVNMPYALYPDAEEFLAIADILVTDWSSMAFDYLPLRRPTIFLDVPPPFKDGFTLGPEHRFGDVVGSLDDYVRALEMSLADPAAFEARHAEEIRATRDTLYGTTLDGKAAKRQYARLRALVLGSGDLLR